MASLLSHCVHFGHKFQKFGCMLLHKVIFLLNKLRFSLLCLIKSLELLQWQQLSIMQQLGASVFHTVVHWHKLGEVDNEYTAHNFVILVICVPVIVKFGGDSTKFWQKQVGSFFGTFYRYMMMYTERWEDYDASAGAASDAGTECCCEMSRDLGAGQHGTCPVWTLEPQALAKDCRDHWSSHGKTSTCFHFWADP